MSTRSYLILSVAATLALFTCAGCGGAAIIEGTGEGASPDPATIDPFGASDVDLKDDSGAFSASDKYDLEDLEVPGAKWGSKDDGKRQNCRRGKRGDKCRERNAQIIPFSDALYEQTVELPWGLHVKSVAAYFVQQVGTKYNPELKAAGGAIEEDRIRSSMIREIDAMRKSYVEFTGQRTGFEGSLIEQEFTHNNGESMLMWDAGTHVEYLFFFNGRLWKRVRAFRKDKLNNLSFDEFIGTLTNRFGEGKELFNSAGEFHQMRWKDDETYATAEDRGSFFGVYVLIFTARSTQDNLAKMRKNEGMYDGKVKDDVSGMVESVTSGDFSDSHTSIVDQYTGTESETPRTASDSASSTGKAKTPDSAPKKAEKKEKKDDQGSPDEGQDLIDDLF